MTDRKLTGGHSSAAHRLLAAAALPFLKGQLPFSRVLAWCKPGENESLCPFPGALLSESRQPAPSQAQRDSPLGQGCACFLRLGPYSFWIWM